MQSPEKAIQGQWNSTAPKECRLAPQPIHHARNIRKSKLALRLHHLPPLYLDRICRLELHLSLLQDDRPGPATLMDDLWAAPWRLEGSEPPALGLALEPLVLFLAAHLDKHIFLDGTGQLYWFCDLHELIVRMGPTLRWDKLQRLALDLGKGKSLARTLGWLQTYWGTPLPKGVAAGGGLPLPQILANGRRRRLDPAWDPARSRVWHRLGQVRHAPGWRAKALFLTSLVLPSRAKMKALHEPRSPLAWVFWYLAHPFWKGARLTAQFISNLWHRTGG